VKNARKPLVLRGARQVGKTSAVKLFAEQNFKDFIYINMERGEDREIFSKVSSISDFEKTVELVLKKKIVAGDTLLFIDEIQNAPNLIELLRFFYEERSDWHVVAAGSLLEVMLEKLGLTMPVGRIEYVYMHPLTFFEFLEVTGEEALVDFLRKLKLDEMIPESVHLRAMKLFYDYTLIGGMPEAVAMFANKNSQEEINSLYSSLLTAYTEDIYKYASSADVKYVQYVIERAPYFAGERVIYEKFGTSQYRSREMSRAFDVLEKAMIVNRVAATNSIELPIMTQGKRAKKILFLDSGFVNYKNNIQTEFLGLHDLSSLYRGRIAEQIVGQNLLAMNIHSEQSLSYWAKDRQDGSAEVDFCFAAKGKIVGVEVKSGHSARLKSLFSFSENIKNNKSIRIYDGPVNQEQIVYAGKKYNILSLPFYLVNRVVDFC